mgnify:CR=1 FL=1
MRKEERRLDSSRSAAEEEGVKERDAVGRGRGLRMAQQAGARTAEGLCSSCSALGGFATSHLKENRESTAQRVA